MAAALLLAALSCPSAQAEVSVYGKLDLMQYTQPQSSGKVTMYGGGIGIDYTFVHGLIAAAMVTQADGNAEREAALLMLAEKQQGRTRRITVGADKA